MNNNNRIIGYVELEPLFLKIKMLIPITLVWIFSILVKLFHHINIINQINLCFSRYIFYVSLNHKNLDHILEELLIINYLVMHHCFLSIYQDHI